MPSPYRDRFLPDLLSTGIVSPERAMVDRVEVALHNWSVLQTEEQFKRTIVDAVGRLGREETEDVPPLFQTIDPARIDNYVAASTRPLPANKSAAHYWFGGVLRARFNEGSVQRPHFNAIMNINRFIQAVKLVRPPKSGPIFANRVPRLTTQVDQSWWKNETPLLVDSNIIAGGDLRYQYALSKSAGEHLQEAIALMFLHLRGRFEAAGVPSERISAAPDFSLKGIEIYWEFSATETMRLVDLLIPQLIALSQRSRVSGKWIKPPAVTTKSLSRSVSIDIATGILLRVYAKTTKRIRFEVVFSAKVATTIAPAASRGEQFNLEQRIFRLSEVAADYVNQILRKVLTNPEWPVQSKTPDDLRRAIANASPNPSVALAILQSLIITGGVNSGGDEGIQHAIEKLRPRVLEAVRNYARHYRLKANFTDALEQIRNGI